MKSAKPSDSPACIEAQFGDAPPPFNLDKKTEFDIASAVLDEALLQESLCQAAFHGDAQRIIQFLGVRGGAWSTQFPRGFSPLHIAATRGDIHIAQILLAHGFDVNKKIDPNARTSQRIGWTPLDLAAHAGHLEMVEVLCSTGASSENAIKLALERGHHGIALWLLGPDFTVHGEEARRCAQQAPVPKAPVLNTDMEAINGFMLLGGLRPPCWQEAASPLEKMPCAWSEC